MNNTQSRIHSTFNNTIDDLDWKDIETLQIHSEVILIESSDDEYDDEFMDTIGKAEQTYIASQNLQLEHVINGQQTARIVCWFNIDLFKEFAEETADTNEEMMELKITNQSQAG